MNPNGTETLPTPAEPGKIWYCRHCGKSARIHTFTNPKSQIVEKELDIPGFATQYVCLNDGLMGRMCDRDAPIQITEEQHDEYWYELQNDTTFIPPEE